MRDDLALRKLRNRDDARSRARGQPHGRPAARTFAPGEPFRMGGKRHVMDGEHHRNRRQYGSAVGGREEHTGSGIARERRQYHLLPQRPAI
jgi:hypothetical protein